MKKYTLCIWVTGQSRGDEPWFSDTVEAWTPEEASWDVTGAMRHPNAVLTLSRASETFYSAVSGSKILWVEAHEQISQTV